MIIHPHCASIFLFVFFQDTKAAEEQSSVSKRQRLDENRITFETGGDLLKNLPPHVPVPEVAMPKPAASAARSRLPQTKSDDTECTCSLIFLLAVAFLTILCAACSAQASGLVKRFFVSI